MLCAPVGGSGPRRSSRNAQGGGRLIGEALKGNIAALKEVADRIDGRVPQAQIIQGYDDGGPIKLYAAVPMKSADSEAWLRASKTDRCRGSRRSRINTREA